MDTKNLQKIQKSKVKTSSKESYSKFSVPVKTEIFGVGITNENQENILEYIRKTIKNSTENYYIVTPNPEIVTFAMSHPDFREILNNANLALNDGVGIGLAGKIMAKSLHERFTGVDFMESVCEKAVDWPITVGFLGGRGKIAERTSECLARRYPGLKVGFVGEEWHDAQPQKPIDVLFVAFGFPKQEQWMAKHINKVPVRVMVGVGGAFDQIVHPSLRPPKLIQSMGLGWLYRLILQPWRIKRQTALLQFARITLAARLRK